MECYECGQVATATRTEASTDECDAVCPVCADYEIAAGYPMFPLSDTTLGGHDMDQTVLSMRQAFHDNYGTDNEVALHAAYDLICLLETMGLIRGEE